MPLLEIQLELVAPDIVWKPELGEGADRKGVRDMVKKWLRSFCEVGRCTFYTNSTVTVTDSCTQTHQLLLQTQSASEHAPALSHQTHSKHPCPFFELQVGGLMKRLDVGEGSYAKELEEDYEVSDAMHQVCVVIGLLLGGYAAAGPELWMCRCKLCVCWQRSPPTHAS